MPLRLKTLELHGYKTFASKTVFEFADNITAIVGPNGSGKSNITDSIRWVLGEQSYSLLRARKTEDMIFSGSENRPRAGMASATITFDNSDGWLPIDFSEVAITRRAYRDGLNEYLINGQKVRLKDVLELLAQSGLAERTYTVIGQGLVDAALALRPEDRRRLFEEAAGIGLYRARREEALRRLEITNRNLERVQDILAELQPRLESLERQARRAQEYEQVRADLKIMLRDYYGYHWHYAQQELIQADQTAKLHEAKLEQAQMALEAVEQKAYQLGKRIREVRVQLGNFHKQLADLTQQREVLHRDIAVAEERRRAWVMQQQELNTGWANLQEEAQFHQAQLEAISKEIEQLNEELREAQNQAQVAQVTLQEQQKEREELERELQDIQRSFSELTARESQVQARLSERRAQVQGAREALKSLLEVSREREKEARWAQERLEVARKEQEEAQQAYQQVQRDYEKHLQELAALEERQRTLLKEHAELSVEQERIRAQLEVMQGAEAALIGYVSGTRILLQAARQGRITGMRGAFNQFLEVPEELERAISSALDSYIDAVVLEGDAQEALELLGSEAGRGILLPIESLARVKPMHLTDRMDKNVLGIAAELVKAPPELQPAVDLLLGQTLVVRDRAVAQRMLHEQPAGVRIVTLRGEVFHASGPIHVFGGKEEEPTPTLLQRTRQIAELAQQLEQMAQQIASTEKRLKAEEDQVKRALAEKNRLEGLLEGAQGALNQAQTKLSACLIEVDQVRQRLEWQAQQVKRLENEIEEQEAELVRLSAAQEQVKAQRQGLQKEQNRLSARLRDRSSDEVQASLAHWTTLVAVAERAHKDALARKQERQSHLTRVLNTLDQLQSRLDKLTHDLEELEKQSASQRQTKEQIEDQIKAVQAQIEPLEAEVEALEREQANIHEQELKARQALSQAERYHAQARITLTRQQETLHTLFRRIEDDLGLVALEYTEPISGQPPLPLEGLVEQLPREGLPPPLTEETIKRQKAQLRRMGAVNPEALTEYKEVKERYEYLNEQLSDLKRAEQDVRKVIAELDALMERDFRQTFEAVAEEFQHIFSRLFDGGSARLTLTNPEDITNTGIDIEARLPGRRTQGLAVLSGGERSLTAVALIFALIKVSPTPFCMLDEVDAMLDETNVARFCQLLRELSNNSQFVVVTHNRSTVQIADIIYGVTMGRDSVSQVLSLKLDQVADLVE